MSPAPPAERMKLCSPCSAAAELLLEQLLELLLLLPAPAATAAAAAPAASGAAAGEGSEPMGLCSCMPRALPSARISEAAPPLKLSLWRLVEGSERTERPEVTEVFLRKTALLPVDSVVEEMEECSELTLFWSHSQEPSEHSAAMASVQAASAAAAAGDRLR